MAEMLNASQGIYPCEGEFCLLVETVSHHKDFEEPSSSKLTTAKKMCVWSSYTFGLFINEAAKGTTLQKSYIISQQEKYIRRVLEEKEGQKQKETKCSQSNRKLSMCKLRE